MARKGFLNRSSSFYFSFIMSSCKEETDPQEMVKEMFLFLRASGRDEGPQEHFLSREHLLGLEHEMVSCS